MTTEKEKRGWNKEWCGVVKERAEKYAFPVHVLAQQQAKWFQVPNALHLTL